METAIDQQEIVEIRVNEQKHQVDRHTITCEEVASMAEIGPPGEVCVCLHRHGAEPQVLQLGEAIDLTSQSIECFRVHERRVIAVSVNSTTIQLDVPTTGEAVKRAAIDAGVRIDLDFVLFLEREDGQADQVDDADLVVVEEGVCFVALAGDDNS